MEVHNVTETAETFTANVYLALGERPTLVDAGAMSGVVEVIAQHTDDVDAVVLTHQHGDHIEQLDAVLGAFDADLYCYADHPQRTERLDDGDEVLIGDERCEAVYTPGHADDHLAFVGDTSLFSGDVVVHDDGAFAYGSFGRTDKPGRSRDTLIESLQRLLDRLPDTTEHMYAGHGGVFQGDVRDVIEVALWRAEKHEPKYE